MMVRRVAFAICVLLNFVLLYGLIWGQQGAIAYKRLKEQCLRLERQVVELDASNLALSKEILLLKNDEKYVEKMIRKRLNFVRNNEILYIFPEQAKTTSSGATPHEAKD